MSERLWERAFQLAYFILMDRSRARECVARALEKLAAQRSREKRRAYWRGRKRDLKIRRISRPAEDTLQWLIYLESELYERALELEAHPTEADLVVRYVKQLAQLTTVTSSFHVNVGFNRLLRNYTTPEVQQVYELATGRYPSSEEYRKAKGKLLSQLAARFTRFLRVRTGQYGELQFATHEEGERWSGLVEECLQRFAPWSSGASCFPRGRGAMAHRQAGYFKGVAPTEDHLETSRCHWFMHSTCYGRLVEQLGFDPPRERLAVPRFLHHDGGDAGSAPASFERRTAPLSNEETRMLRERAASVASASDEMALVPLKIVVHGAICATLDPRRDERRQFDIAESTRLVEVRSEEDDRVLATHWMDYDEHGRFIDGEYTLTVQGRRQLALTVVPISDGSEPAGTRAVVAVEARSASTLGERWRSLGSVFGYADNLLRPVLVCLALVALGGLAASAYLGSRILDDRAAIGHLSQEVASQRAVIVARERASSESLPTITRYALRSALPNLRGTGNTGEPVVTFAPGESLVILELPVPVHPGESGPYRISLRSFPQEHERLTEAALRPVKHADRWIVEFPLPAALVEADTHYLLTLAPTGGGDSERYLLQVRKKVR